MFSSERGHNIALYPERQDRMNGKARSGRPVALPALAAAVQVARGSAKSEQSGSARPARPFVHEDDPLI